MVQIEESASPAVTLDRVKAAGHAFNQSKKGRRVPVSNVAETLENVPRKFWKTDRADEKTLVKTKLACLVIPTNGKI